MTPYNYIDWLAKVEVYTGEGGGGETAGDIFFYHTDYLGSVRMISDISGAVVWQKRYAPFGGEEEQSGTIENTYQFTGKGWDEDAQLFYFNARWYDSDVGRFISEDPLWGNIFDPQSLNRYRYARNNPFKLKDPYGKWDKFNDDDDEGLTEDEIMERDIKNDPVYKEISKKIGKALDFGYRLDFEGFQKGTLGIGPSVTGGRYGKGGTGGAQIVTDTKGNVGIAVYGGGGAYYSGSPGLSGGIDVTVTNAETIFDLEDTGGQTGVSAGGPSGSITGEAVYGDGYVGGNVNIGISTPGVNATSFVTKTKVYGLWSATDEIGVLP